MTLTKKRIIASLFVLSYVLIVIGMRQQPLELNYIYLGSFLNLTVLGATWFSAYQRKDGILWLVSLFFISGLAVPAYLFNVPTIKKN